MPRERYRPLIVGTLGSEIQGAAACERCGALVGGMDRETHDHWHELVEGAWRD